MASLRFTAGGADVLDASGRVLFGGTLEQCEEFLDLRENGAGGEPPAVDPLHAAPPEPRRIFPFRRAKARRPLLRRTR